MQIIFGISPTFTHLPGPRSSVAFISGFEEPAIAMGIAAKRPRVHVVELGPFGFRYYRGSFKSFESAPPKYTWRKVDYRVEDTVVYADLQGSEPMVDGLNYP